MSDSRRVRNGLNKGKCTMSAAAEEAFKFLNAGTRLHYRGWGDTATAARDRAAKEAGVTPAQAERVWKRWKQMASVDGDVYRLLRNKYEGLCEATEALADRLEERRLGRDGNAVVEGRQAAVEGMVAGHLAGEEVKGEE